MASQRMPLAKRPSLEEFIARIAANLANAPVEPEEAARGLSVFEKPLALGINVTSTDRIDTAALER